jgi:TonB family protein
MKSPVLVIIAMSCWLVTAASAVEVKPPALPPDAELKKWIVGNWRVDYPNEGSAAEFGYEIYAENGTFKHFGEVKDYGAPPRLLFKVSGTWDVRNGVLVKTTTAANVSTWTGDVSRQKIESVGRDWFIVKGKAGTRTRRRAQLPTDVASGAAEVPKVFTVKEAAQILRYAARPEYSREARERRASGFGLFELHFDYETGRLKAIDIVKSTGSSVLDHDTIAGLKEWRAKPHTIRVMRIPVTFETPEIRPKGLGE